MTIAIATDCVADGRLVIRPVEFLEKKATYGVSALVSRPRPGAMTDYDGRRLNAFFLVQQLRFMTEI